jgi:hypothetical protein
MKSHLAGCTVRWGACVMLFTNIASAANDQTKPATMRFEWNTDVASCGAGPPRVWISAIGPVTESTAADFEAFAGSSDLRGTVIVLDSEGGSVLSALDLGRAIRRREMTTTVGKTEKVMCADGTVSHSTVSSKVSCESMCAFVLLGGVHRYVPIEARVLVHQIWLGSKRNRSLAYQYTANEVSLVLRDLAALARYTIEMGVSIELVETAMRVPPWLPSYRLSRDQLRRFAVATDEPSSQMSASVASIPTANAAAQDVADNLVETAPAVTCCLKSTP